MPIRGQDPWIGLATDGQVEISVESVGYRSTFIGAAGPCVGRRRRSDLRFEEPELVATGIECLARERDLLLGTRRVVVLRMQSLRRFPAPAAG